MTVMRHHIEIARAPEQVLAYAASATRWPEWHPSSLSVDGPAGPLPAGTCFEEDIEAGGRPGHLHWEVIEYIPGQRWQARAQGNRHGLTLQLTYECHATAGGTQFVRTLEYRMSGLLMQWTNHLLLKRRIARESEASLRNLGARAEQLLAPAATDFA
ncbi:SRPBCC family protein [Solimonas sp. K1W22B-7]|nr:SRPBCC family protein [Solimonas sp. K1W22B-7]AXQ28157.1 SRPBCC family protein [Solimonas sp. K1W22B-7]